MDCDKNEYIATLKDELRYVSDSIEIDGLQHFLHMEFGQGNGISEDVVHELMKYVPGWERTRLPYEKSKGSLYKRVFSLTEKPEKFELTARNKSSLEKAIMAGLGKFQGEVAEDDLIKNIRGYSPNLANIQPDDIVKTMYEFGWKRDHCGVVGFYKSYRKTEKCRVIFPDDLMSRQPRAAV